MLKPATTIPIPNGGVIHILVDKLEVGPGRNPSLLFGWEHVSSDGEPVQRETGFPNESKMWQSLVEYLVIYLGDKPK